MIGAVYCRTMGRYQHWQNAALVAAADGLDPEALTLDRGAFFGSVQGTFNHLLWGDMTWMSRFDGEEKPRGGIAESPGLIADWQQFKIKRVQTNERILMWANSLRDSDLAGDLTWFSGAVGHEVTKPLAFCVTHFFNHGTHHRGQIHAMLTAAGAKTDDTDLFVMPEGV